LIVIDSRENSRTLPDLAWTPTMLQSLLYCRGVRVALLFS
jgi:hypothetical protein